MPEYKDFIGSDGKLDMPKFVQAAIPINRKGQVDREDLYRIRSKMAYSKLALENMGGFLRYARGVVDSSLARLSAGRRATFHDCAFAEVGYGKEVFLFIPQEHAARLRAACQL
jgi:hypothetical protein